MKKVLLSLAVIATFTFYSWHEKNEGASIQVGLPTPIPNPTPTLNNNSREYDDDDEGRSVVPPTLTPTPTPTPTNTVNAKYKDGTFTGPVTDAYYGDVQVQVLVRGGKITDVSFLKYPNDRSTSIRINSQAMPYLRQEAIQAQSSSVDIISGATQTSIAFRQSLKAALQKAQ